MPQIEVAFGGCPFLRQEVSTLHQVNLTLSRLSPSMPTGDDFSGEEWHVDYALSGGTSI